MYKEPRHRLAMDSEPGRYSYHYLKYREGAKSISNHIPKDQVEGLIGKLEARVVLAKRERINLEYIRHWLKQFEESLGEPFL